MNYNINETPISITASREEVFNIYNYMGHAIYTEPSYAFFTKLGRLLRSNDDTSNHTFMVTDADIYRILQGIERSPSYDEELKNHITQLKHTLEQQGRWNPDV